MKKTLYSLLGMAAVLLVACSSEQKTQGPQAVNALTVHTDTVAFPLTAPAVLHGKQDIAIIPQVSATITEVLVIEGDHVTKDQPMFKLNQSEYQAEVDNAQAMVNSARTKVMTAELQMDAKQQLFDKDIISEHEYKVQQNEVQIAHSGLDEALAKLHAAQTNLSYTIIRAPHTGVVGTINYKQGALVGPSINEPMTIVSDNSTIYAYISISGDRYMHLLDLFGSKDSLIAFMPPFTFYMGNDKAYSEQGKLETISGIIDENTGSVSMRVAFPNANGILATGAGGRCEIKLREKGIAVPRTAVFSIQDKDYVFVLEPTDKKDEYSLKQVMVDVDRLSDSEYVVESGLSDGQIIVTEGVKKLNQGQLVTINHAA